MNKRRKFSMKCTIFGSYTKVRTTTNKTATLADNLPVESSDTKQIFREEEAICLLISYVQFT